VYKEVKGEKMKTKLLTITLILSLAMNFGFIFSYLMISREHRQVYANEDFRHVKKLPKNLNLSKEQTAMFKEQGEKIRIANSSYRDSMTQMNMIIFDLLRNPKTDTFKIDSILREISRMQARMQRNAILQFVGNRDILTAEQHEILMKTIKMNLPPCGMEPPPMEEFKHMKNDK